MPQIDHTTPYMPASSSTSSSPGWVAGITSIQSSASSSASSSSSSASSTAAAIAASRAVDTLLPPRGRLLVVLRDEVPRLRPRPRPCDDLCEPVTSNCDRSRRALGFARRSRRCDRGVCLGCRRCVDLDDRGCGASSSSSSAISADGTVIFSLFGRRGRPRRFWTISGSRIRSRGSSMS